MKLWEWGVFGLLVVAVVGSGESDGQRARPAAPAVARPGVVTLTPGTIRAADAVHVDGAVGFDFDLSRPPARSKIGQRGRPSGQQLDRGFRFAATVTKEDRRTLRRIVSFARPAAKRLIGAVDGLTTVRVASLQPPILGTAQRLGHGRYSIEITRSEMRPPRGSTAFTVLHELGHVVDFALVPDDVRDRLASYACMRARPSACGLTERFAEGFAVWALTPGNLPLREAPKPRQRLDTWSAVLGRLVDANPPRAGARRAVAVGSARIPCAGAGACRRR